MKAGTGIPELREAVAALRIRYDRELHECQCWPKRPSGRRYLGWEACLGCGKAYRVWQGGRGVSRVLHPDGGSRVARQRVFARKSGSDFASCCGEQAAPGGVG